jgi:hypothetical protein
MLSSIQNVKENITVSSGQVTTPTLPSSQVTTLNVTAILLSSQMITSILSSQQIIHKLFGVMLSPSHVITPNAKNKVITQLYDYSKVNHTFTILAILSPNQMITSMLSAAR